MITTKSYFKKNTFQNTQRCTGKELQNIGLKWSSLRHMPILCVSCNTCSNCYYIETTLNSSFEIVRSFSWPLNPKVWWAYFFRKRKWRGFLECAVPLNEQGLLGERTLSAFHLQALTRILPASLLGAKSNDFYFKIWEISTGYRKWNIFLIIKIS